MVAVLKRESPRFCVVNTEEALLAFARKHDLGVTLTWSHEKDYLSKPPMRGQRLLNAFSSMMRTIETCCPSNTIVVGPPNILQRCKMQVVKTL